MAISTLFVSYQLYTVLRVILYTDVNECGDDLLHYCEQVCNNTHGSHSCLCLDGYQLNSDGYSCTGQKEIFHFRQYLYSQSVKVTI